MARINADTLTCLATLCEKLRVIPGLVETKPGIFYVKRIPMLHFHETDSGVVAGLKCVTPNVAGFDRFTIDTAHEKQALVTETTARCRFLLEKQTR